MTRSLAHQVGRYLLVGLAVYAVDLSTYAMIIWLAPDGYLLANVCGKLAGAASGFLLHKHLTFGGPQRHGADRQLIFYGGLLLFNMAGSSGLLWLVVAQGGDKLIARIAIDCLVVMFSFLAMRLLIYRPL